MAKSIPVRVSNEFQFEDLFGGSSPSPSNSLASSWNNVAPPSPSSHSLAGSWSSLTPDGASLQKFETIEEDIGGEADCTGEEANDEATDGGKEQAENQENGGLVSPGKRESIKLSTTIGMDSFTTLALVGKGGYGVVHQVVFKENNQVFAMKTLKKKHLIELDCVSSTMTEKDVLRKIRHPFVVRLHYAFQSETKLHLVMDFVNGGHLLHHMRSHGSTFSEDQARFYIAEVILALEHLHSLDIVHRDLKPENCLLDSTGHCVLTDFGFAKENVNRPDSCSSFCGTLEYMAPEVLKLNKYGKPADWWSVGILLYDMLVGDPPFLNANDAVLTKKILNDSLKLPMFLSGTCRSLLKGLLQREVKKRLNIFQIKSHPFFKTLNWKRLLNKELRPPIVPILKKGALDVSQFDPIPGKRGDTPNSPLSTSQQLQFKGFSYAESSFLHRPL